jgi:hypothetical protein
VIPEIDNWRGGSGPNESRIDPRRRDVISSSPLSDR